MFKSLTKLTILIVILIASGCQENEQINPDDPINTNLNSISHAELTTIQDQLSKRFAKILSNRISSLELREFIKKEACKKFDGDYDILLSKVINKPLSEGRSSNTFRSLISSTSITNNREESDINNLIDSLNLFHPLLQISVPELQNSKAELWNTIDHKPLVAILDSRFDDQKSEFIVAYDDDGNEYKLSVAEEPENLVIVVGESERIAVINKNSSSSNNLGECDVMVFEDANYTYYEELECLGEDVLNLGSESKERPTNFGRSESGGTCRSSRKREYMYEMRCVNNCGESWANGAPELKFRVIAENSAILLETATLKPDKRDDIVGDWWRNEFFMFRWDTPITDEYVTYVWWEKDGGSPINLTFKIGIPISNVTLGFNSKDDQLGQRLVFIDDCQLSNDYPAGHRYQNWEYQTPGGIKWKTKIWH